MTDYNPEVPRVYTTFAEFERDELLRLGLTAWPTPSPLIEPLVALAASAEAAPTAIVAVPRPFVRVTVPRPTVRVSITHPTPAILNTLRTEGILEIGRAPGTSALFVRTRERFHVVHATWLPDRQLDDYAVQLAVTWIEDHGLPSCEVAKNLGVSETTLRQALLAAGYDRMSPAQLTARAGARAARTFGNRRGRLVRTDTDAGAQT